MRFVNRVRAALLMVTATLAGCASGPRIDTRYSAVSQGRVQ